MDKIKSFLVSQAGEYTYSFLAWLPDLFTAFLIAVGAWWASLWVKRLVDRATRRLGGDEILWNYLSTATRYGVIVIGYVTALKQAHFPVDALLTTFGISGVIIGFGARTSIANYFSGIMMLAARPFKQGDLIEFGPPAQIGRVTEVKMTYTGLVTLDNVRVVVPNLVMWRNKIVNFSSFDTRAIRIPMRLSYETDVDWVEDLALGVLREHEAVLNEPPPSLTVSDATSEHILVLLEAWSQVETMKVFGDIITQMRKEFEQAGLEVAVPAKDIDLRREE
ncbi:MAG: small conductance mechanosensitive channel [Candidatus Latescibacterota bacterium]|jgi:small conductance mechanosensitive channel